MISWIKDKCFWILAGLVALVSVYILGKSEGKNDEKHKQDKQKLDQVASAKRIDDLPDAVIDKLPSKYD